MRFLWCAACVPTVNHFIKNKTKQVDVYFKMVFIFSVCEAHTKQKMCGTFSLFCFEMIYLQKNLETCEHRSKSWQPDQNGYLKKWALKIFLSTLAISPSLTILRVRFGCSCCFSAKFPTFNVNIIAHSRPSTSKYSSPNVSIQSSKRSK